MSASLRRSMATSARARCGFEYEAVDRPGGRGRVLARSRPGEMVQEGRGVRPRDRRALRALHAEAAAGRKQDWAKTPEGALALLLVLDQFSRNMFRGTPKAFAQDEMARAIAREARRRGLRRAGRAGASASSSTCRSCIRRRSPTRSAASLLIHAFAPADSALCARPRADHPALRPLPASQPDPRPPHDPGRAGFPRWRRICGLNRP